MACTCATLDSPGSPRQTGPDVRTSRPLRFDAKTGINIKKNFNPDSSPKLPADLYADADRTAQAVFEGAVADGSYFADPDFEWEPGWRAAKQLPSPAPQVPQAHVLD